MIFRPFPTCLFPPCLLATLIVTIAPQPILAASSKAAVPDGPTQSFYPVRLEDKTAVYLSPSNDRFGTKGDGVADDTDALQKAIDTVADTTHQGIVFIPEGRYRLTRTVWRGVRFWMTGSGWAFVFFSSVTGSRTSRPIRSSSRVRSSTSGSASSCSSANASSSAGSI